MLIIYSLIIVLTFSVFGYIVLDNYKVKGIRDEETRLFQAANIVADTYRRNLDDIVYTKIMVKTYAHQVDARIIIVDNHKEVLVDSYNSYLGDKLNNKEIRNSLMGQSDSGIYTLDTREILQLAVPLVMSTEVESEIIGAVLVSASMDPLNIELEDLTNDILRISAISLIGALLLTAISATGLTKSMKALTTGVEKISSGQLGYRIEKSERGEVGRLIETFNDMSQKLNNIEKNRKYFINSISHELKTPLTSIKVLIDSLSIGNNSIEIYKEYLGDIKDETERMEGLVNYLMGSIKLEELSLDISTEDMGDLIEETVKFITPYAKKNQVEIKLDLLKGITIPCDKNKMKEVLLNIIENSIKYRDTHKNRSFVWISMMEEKEKIILTLEDNGLGIDEDNLTNVFNRGFRVTDDKVIEGYGIGLSIVKNIVDKHKWTISLESSLGKGTKFTIEIPLI